MDWAPGYRELVPSRPGLAPGVSCVWARVVGDADDPVTLVLPDACVDLIWELGRGVYVAGPDTGPAPSPAAPGTVFAGVRFAPGAGGPALGMPLPELLNQRVDAADLGRGPAARLAGLPEDVDPEVALGALVDAASAMVSRGPADRLVTEAARLLGRAGARVGTVAGQLGVSERQLRRRCEAAVGYGPATLRRVLRFRRFVSWVDAGGGATDGGLATIAAELGYADQAHLTREAARLAGLPPASLAAARRPRPARPSSLAGARSHAGRG
jgi:AraC-like DNA-binding protein